MEVETDKTFRRLTQVKGNKRILLDFVGYSSIIKFIKDNPEYNNIENAYKFIMELYNNEVERINEEIRKKNIKIQLSHKKFLRKLKPFLDKKVDNVKFTINSKKELLTLIHSVEEGDKVYLKRNETIYALNDNTKQRLIENMDAIFTDIQEASYVSDAELIANIQDNNTFELTRLIEPTKTLKEGGYFPYEHGLNLDMKEHQIFKKGQFKASLVKENCFIQSLINSGLEIKKVEHARRICCNRDIPVRVVKKICEEIDIHISVHYMDSYKVKPEHYGNRELPEIKIANICNHYFNIDYVLVTNYALKNYDKIKHISGWKYMLDSKRAKIPKEERKNRHWHRIENNGKYSKRIGFATNFDVVKWMLSRDDMLFKIKNCKELYKSQYHSSINANSLDKQLENISDLNYTDDAIEFNKYDEKDDWNYVTIGFDFECHTKGTHKAYEVCCYDGKQMYSFSGSDCGKKMLNMLCKKYNEYDGIKLIAHYVSYDINFLFQYFDYFSSIERGSLMLSGKGSYYYYGKCVKFKIQDSYALIPKPLKDFGKMFHLEQSKEIMPYSLMSEEKDNYIYSMDEINDALLHQFRCDNIGEKFNLKKYEMYKSDFMENVKKSNSLVSENRINMMKYSTYYCKMDCMVLYQGWMKFKEWINEICGLNIEHYVSLPSLADAYLKKEGCYNDVYLLGQQVREFVQLAMVGGRCMTRQNEKWHVKNMELNDFDAVSLYPSAMHRLGGFVKGKPKILDSSIDLSKTTTYVVEIIVRKIGKTLDFPLISYIDDKGNRHFTNDMVNRKIVVDKIALEDLVKFQDIEYEIVRGYYWDEGRCEKLGDVIQKLFNKRLEEKKKDNPIQEVYKLLMNSSYGKTLLKPFDTETKFLNKKNYNEYVAKYYNYIQEVTTIYNTDEKRIKALGEIKCYRVKSYNSINKHYNNAICGVEILSMSKRIMNEVMCLAEEKKIDMFYTDTDSIHIDNNKINLLENEYRLKYDRELIGKNMGQFHCDFEMEGAENIKAIESIFVGKKSYMDVLIGEKKKDDDKNVIKNDKKKKIIRGKHLRLKGIPNKSIKYLGFGRSRGIRGIYLDLIKKKEVEFDLTCDGLSCRFKNNNNMTIETLDIFKRKVKFSDKKINIK